VKYIIFRSPEGPRVSIFAAPTTHAEEAAAHPSWKPESAGFLVFRSIDCVQCFDRSESLNLKPRAMDDSMIEVLTAATLMLTTVPPPPVTVRFQ
jgi:hypothetical protein